ncbi:MAG: hypothetical protein JNK04_23335, partial [Myxococcales bacterium]|nr:hypothetical protein [Myxococcales bacterium]
MPSIDLSQAFTAAGLAPQLLSQFLGGVVPLTGAERRTIVEQALLLMEEVYVHLPLKRAMHAVDPVQRLRLLRHRLDLVDDRAFHEEMISTFMGVRDLHTNYILPDPYNRTTAFLPFQVREFFREGVPIYIVGGVLQGLEHPTFKPGVRVTHMNGVPIARAVALNARRHAGSNAAANHARGLERLTFRPLMMSLPPDEEWADIRYNAADGTVQELRFNWLAYTQPASLTQGGAALSVTNPKNRWLFAQGVDIQTEAVNEVKKRLFARERVEIEAAVLAY